MYFYSRFSIPLCTSACYGSDITTKRLNPGERYGDAAFIGPRLGFSRERDFARDRERVVRRKIPIRRQFARHIATRKRQMNVTNVSKVTRQSCAIRIARADSFVKFYNNGTSRYFCKAAQQFA